MKRMHVDVTDLEVSYHTADGTLTIIDGFHLNVHAGEMVCLAGRSGSGKTSILRVLAGLNTPTKGMVQWNETDLASMSPTDIADLRRRQVGYMDQDAGLLPELTAFENCLVPSLPDGKEAVRTARKRAGTALEQIGLQQRLGWRPPQLSGGERQRLVLARILTNRTPAIIADEPTASLDRSWADRVITQLRNHAQHGGLVIVASHDPAVPDVADRTIHLR